MSEKSLNFFPFFYVKKQQDTWKTLRIRLLINIF